MAKRFKRWDKPVEEAFQGLRQEAPGNLRALPLGNWTELLLLSINNL
jgi:hypothetical protein